MIDDDMLDILDNAAKGLLRICYGADAEKAAEVWKTMPGYKRRQKPTLAYTNARPGTNDRTRPALRLIDCTNSDE